MQKHKYRDGYHLTGRVRATISVDSHGKDHGKGHWGEKNNCSAILIVR